MDPNKSNKVIASSSKSGTMFIFNADHPKHTTLYHSELSKDIHVWHKRFGHLSYSSLLSLSKSGNVSGLPALPAIDTSFICVSCVSGMHQRAPFKPKTRPT
eukprot:c56712_g1_i1 orf=56-358(-)